MNIVETVRDLCNQAGIMDKFAKATADIKTLHDSFITIRGDPNCHGQCNVHFDVSKIAAAGDKMAVEIVPGTYVQFLTCNFAVHYGELVALSAGAALMLVERRIDGALASFEETTLWSIDMINGTV